MRNSRKPCSSSASRRSAGREPRGVDVARLERAHVELEPVAEALDAAEHAHRVALAEAPVEQLDVVPDARVDAAARVDELEREVRRAALRPQLRLRLTAKTPSTTRSSASSAITRTERLYGSGQAVAQVSPFRALRYDEPAPARSRISSRRPTT